MMKKTFTIWTLILSASMIVQCQRLQNNYTWESVSARLSELKWIFIVWLILLLLAQRRGEERRLSANAPINKKDSAVNRRVGIGVLMASFLLIFAGIRNGGMQDVLIKAINICTECIGLG